MESKLLVKYILKSSDLFNKPEMKKIWWVQFIIYILKIEGKLPIKEEFEKTKLGVKNQELFLLQQNEKHNFYKNDKNLSFENVLNLEQMKNLFLKEFNCKMELWLIFSKKIKEYSNFTIKELQSYLKTAIKD